MAFRKHTANDIYLKSTAVENIYITEGLVDAPSDYVKVYLYGLFSSEYQRDSGIEDMAKKLNLPEDTIDAAFSYYENLGFVKRIPEGDSYSVEFLSLRETIYGKFTEKKEEEKKSMVEDDMKELFRAFEEATGRTLSSKDLLTVKSWRKDYNITSDVILGAARYCSERGKDNVKYIEKVVCSWNDRGLKTEEDVKEYIRLVDEKQDAYRRILGSLGIRRNATDAEKELMDSWLDEKKFTVEKILDACGRTIATTNPNLRYVNAILESWAKEAKAMDRDVNSNIVVSKKTVTEYYQYLRDQAEEKAKERKEEVYTKVPELKEIDKNINEIQREITMKVLRRVDVSGLKKNVLDLEASRALLLTENGFPMDYTNIRYLCSRCRDTGIDENGGKCSCYSKRYSEAELWQKK
ncbi:MAG: DnaD domain protein [Clostridia bacterium]|nr:DnaD domain protein [Clostridia bacterium]